MYFVACFALLFFDYGLTLGNEVELVWKGKKTPMFWLFMIVSAKNLHSRRRIRKSCSAQNRYIPMAFCIITLFAYFSPLWDFPRRAKDLRCTDTRNSCNRFAIVEWLQTLLIVVPAEVVLLLRVYALTNRNKYLLVLLVAIIVTECIIVFYAMSIRGTNDALPLPHVPIDSFHADIVFCRLLLTSNRDTAYLSTSIGFDSIVFAITIACTTIRWDGTMYFCVILSGNAVWMALAINARPGLKLMNAHLTSIMINRLTLSVRKAAEEWARTTDSIELPSRIFPRTAHARSLASGHGIPARVHLAVS
ncbi:hypothetical protein B0H10DRAFT_2068315 [Mycena sp. CBHHK59/15]|nr:hypothetical protein B0H10DRAFT_2068315 [Mycena sp. CBHHK59/15]